MAKASLDVDPEIPLRHNFRTSELSFLASTPLSSLGPSIRSREASPVSEGSRNATSSYSSLPAHLTIQSTYWLYGESYADPGTPMLSQRVP